MTQATRAWFSDDGDEMVTLLEMPATGLMYFERFIRNEQNGWYRSGEFTVERYALAFLVSKFGIGGEAE